jgi:hypothetical protein
MTSIDPVALAIDWMDACHAGDAAAITACYAADATLTASGATGDPVSLQGQEAIASYWAEMLDAGRGGWELVEIYPGTDSAILVYYDLQARRVSEFLRFDAEGRILLSARHAIPRRRQATPRILGAGAERPGDAVSALKLRCEALQSLIEARRLRPGPARNALRQRAHALRQLA